MVSAMVQRIAATAVAIVAAAAAGAVAQPAHRPPPPAATMPAVGDPLDLAGGPYWPKLDWLYDVPSPSDAGGKIVVHWFCALRVKECADDLARLIALRDTGHVYIVAYIDGPKYDAGKLDPIRESEGVGRGTVAYGAGASKLARQLGVAAKPASIIVDVDGKVAAVSIGGAADVLDNRDATVNKLAGNIRAFTTSFESPAKIKAGDRFSLKVAVRLASWLAFAPPLKFDLTAPKDLQCNARTLSGDQLVIEGQNLVAVVTCSAPAGVYEAQGHISFQYTLPTKETGIGEDGTTWKFQVTP
jgi:hypothetical protein